MHRYYSVTVLLLVCGCGGEDGAFASHISATTDVIASAASTSVHVTLGIPKDSDDSDDYLIDKGIYVLSYNSERNLANWVAWRLDATDLGTFERTDHFRSETDLPTTFYHVKSSDYTNSGFDRGHLCPSADRTATAAANDTTFLMTNMHPQLHALNAGAWSEMETFERSLAVPGKNVYIVAGPLFPTTPSTIGHGVQVPSASYKVMIVLNSGEGPSDVTTTTPIYAAVMPNVENVNDQAWTTYMTSVDNVEQLSGYDFFNRVRKRVQTSLERETNVP